MKIKSFVLFIAVAITFGGIVLFGCATEPIKYITLEQVDMQNFFVIYPLGIDSMYRIINGEEIRYDVGLGYFALPHGRYYMKAWSPGGATTQKNIFIDRYGGRTESVAYGFYDWTASMGIFDFEAGKWYKCNFGSNVPKELIIVQPTEVKGQYMDSSGNIYWSRYHEWVYYMDINNPSLPYKEADEKHIVDVNKYLYFVNKINIIEIEPMLDRDIKIFKSDIEKRKK